MSPDILCYNCGSSLEALTPPLSRRDLCPSCSVHLHVCRMCSHYDVSVHGACREDDAEEVRDKEKVNFCDWFVPASGRFDAARRDTQAQARSELEALFGDATGADADEPANEAEKLFRS